MSNAIVEFQAQVPTKRIRLLELEAAIVKFLHEHELEPTKANVAKLGDMVVNRKLLFGYTPARYNRGRWVSPRVMDRVTFELSELTADHSTEADQS